MDDENGNGIDGGQLYDTLQGWKEKLASPSEAIVKAERHGSDSIPDLAKRSTEHVQQKHDAKKRSETEIEENFKVHRVPIG